MFHGSIPADMRSIVRETAKRWDNATDIWVGCSGNFTVERTIMTTGKRIHSNDVTAYPVALGHWFQNREVPFSLKEEHREELAWLEPYLETHIGTMASLMLGTQFLELVGSDKSYKQRRLAAYISQYPQLFAKTVDRLESLDLHVESFHAMDVNEWVETVVPENDPTIMYPPFFCLHQDHRILTDDLRWKRVGDIEAGQGILAFEEYPSGRSRRWEWGTVTRSEPAMAPCVKVTLADGTEITCTRNHPWLAHSNATEGSKGEWVNAEDLKPGAMWVQRLMRTWEQSDTRDAGWLAGMFDGEGNIHLQPSTSKLALSQKEGRIAAEFVQRMTAMGFPVGSSVRPSEVIGFEVQGGLPAIFRVLGTLRPERLIDNLRSQDISMRTTRSRVSDDYIRVAVVSVEDAGMQPIQQIETSTRTYVGEGFAMHNSGDYEGQFEPIDHYFDWPAPEYPDLTEERKDELLEMVRSRDKWVIGLHVERPELRPYLTSRVLTQNRGVPIYVYSSDSAPRIVQPSQRLEFVDTPKLGFDEDMNGPLELRILSQGQFQSLRSQFMSKTIKPGQPLLAIGVVAGGRLIGCFAYGAQTQIGAPKDQIYLLSDFPISWSKYKNLAKLIVMASMSVEAQQLIQRTLSRRINFIETTAFSNRPASMKYRGPMKLKSRGDGDDGYHTYKLQYRGEVGKLTLEEAFTKWRKGPGKTLKPRD